MKILTFDIGGTLIKSAIFDENSGISDYCENSYPKIGKDGVFEILQAQIAKYDFDAIGISTAGLVDTKKGEIIFCSQAIPNYTGTKLKETLEHLTGKPTFVINDVNAAALGESAYGSGKNYEDFICLTYGTGIGGAIVISNEVFEGSRGYAGEIGHIVTHLGGKPCVCGGCGCYNEYASVTALIENCYKIDNKITNGIHIFERLENPKIKGEIDAWIDEIVLGLVTVCHIFNPAAIVLGGGIMNEEYISKAVEKKLRERVMPGYREVVILRAMLGNRAGLMGSAANVLRRINNGF